MNATPRKGMNWWAGLLAAVFIFPVAWLSFDNPTSAIIMAVSAGAVGLFLFPTKQR